MSQLTNQVAVVTGAGRGIGRAIAVRMATTSASLLLAGCAGHISSIHPSTNVSQPPCVFKITAEQADSVARAGMEKEGWGSSRSLKKLPPPEIGYSCSDFGGGAGGTLLDFHVWSTHGCLVEFDEGGQKTSGYIFKVSHHGTLSSGPRRAREIYQHMFTAASEIIAPTELSKKQLATVHELPTVRISSPTSQLKP